MSKRRTTKDKLNCLKNQEMPIKDVAIDSKISFIVLKEVRIALRILSFKYETNMSSILRELVDKLVMGDKYLLGLIADMQIREQEGIYKEMVNFEAESIYKILEEFEDNREEENKEDGEMLNEYSDYEYYIGDER